MITQREEREREERVMGGGDKKLIASSSSSTTSIYNHPPPPPSSSSSSDEISQFLRHLLHRSSPLPSYYSPATNITTPIGVHNDSHAENPRHFVSPPPPPPPLLSKRVIGIDDFSPATTEGGVISSAAAAAACFGFSGNNNAQGNSSGTRVSSSSIGASGNDTDEYDCESEEGVEAVVDDEHPSNKSNPSRSSSKRCRAAEVHNLSEKRRRSRINEKMKALQSLIPNSNKTDKASMLDEAIEYLKQLQLQVQMLTMRNGINLHPLCLPGTTLHPLQLRPAITPEATTNDNNNTLFNHQFGASASTSNAPEMINTSTYALEQPSIRSHFGPFPLFTSPEMNREGGLTHQRLNIGHLNTNLTGEQAAFDGRQADLKDRL